MASPVGINAEIVEDGMTGFLPEDEDAWVTALDDLIGQPALRARMGKAGRERVESRYSLAHSSQKLIGLLSQ